MTTSVTVRVNGNYVREVTVGDGPVNKVGPGSNIERAWEHGECANEQVTISPERPATDEEIAAAAEAAKPGAESSSQPG